MVRVWGLASGKNGTEGAARGAFTTRDYESIEKIREADWLRIAIIENKEGEKPCK
jgi:hypothetical protein